MKVKVIITAEHYRNQKLQWINKIKIKWLNRFLWNIIFFIRKLHPYLDKKLKGELICEEIIKEEEIWA